MLSSVAIAATIAAAPALASAAGMIGQSLQITHAFPTEFTPLQTWLVTVGAGVELPSVAPQGLGPIAIDITETQIVITALADFTAASAPNNPLNGFNGLYFIDINNTIPSFLTATLDPATTAPWFTAFGNLSSSESGIWTNFLNLQQAIPTGQSLSAGQTIVINAIPVPEPGTWMLLLGGLVLLGRRLAIRHRSR